MTTNPPRRRNSNRLQGYDYSQEGAYFVTICTHHRECIFGSILNEQTHLNQIGKIIQTEWIKSAQIRKEIVLGEFVIMPNHIHSIVWIIDPFDGVSGKYDFDDDADVGAYGHTPLRLSGNRLNIGNTSRQCNSGNQYSGEFRSPSKTLGAMIRGFKSASTKQINQIRNTPRTPVFQRGFHDHIIRNEREYEHYYNYILTNPIKWRNDDYFAG